MANVLLIEDNEMAIYAVEQIIESSEHHYIGNADNIEKVQGFLSQIIHQEIEVDVIILDGNLGDSEPNRCLTHTFPPLSTEQPKKRLFRSALPPAPREILVTPDVFQGRLIGADGRMVKKFMELCDIEVPVIGFSSDSMSFNGVRVDYDLGKIYHEHQGPELLTAISTVLR